MDPSLSQLFVSSDSMIPLSDDHILVEDENWLGSTADDYIVFLSQPHYRPDFIEGSKYTIRNCFTTRILYLHPYYFTTFPYNNGSLLLHVCHILLLFVNAKGPNFIPLLQFTFKNQDGGGTAIYNVGYSKWAGPKLRVSEVEYGYHFIPSDIREDSYLQVILHSSLLGSSCQTLAFVQTQIIMKSFMIVV